MSEYTHQRAVESAAARARRKVRNGNILRLALFGIPTAAAVAALAVAGVAGASRRGPDICTYRIPDGYTVSTFAHRSPDNVDDIETRNGIDPHTHAIWQGETIDVACSDQLAELEVQED